MKGGLVRCGRKEEEEEEEEEKSAVRASRNPIGKRIMQYIFPWLAPLVKFIKIKWQIF